WFSYVQPKPEAFIHPDDARALSLADGDAVELGEGEAAIVCTVRVDADVLPGTVQVPRGVADAPVHRLQRGRAFPAVRLSRRVLARMPLVERQLLGYFHLRVGPTRTGPWGLAQPIADAIKAFVKEDVIPAGADKFVFRLAPVISVFTALAVWSVIPVGPPVEI